MAQKVINQRVDLQRQDGGDILLWPNVLAVKGDAYAHLWRVELYDNGVPATLTGQTAQCHVVNGNNQSMTLDASISGNVASISFPSACYAGAGKLRAMMSVAASGQTPTIAMMCLRVQDGMTDVVIDPDDIIPSLSALLALVSELADAADAESSRASAEQSRAIAEGDRATAETARVGAEQARATAEIARAVAEQLRVSSESTRQSAETGRVASEASRADNESARLRAETSRNSAENTRDSNETTRQQNEGTRQVAETARLQAESGRATAETARAAAEESRKGEEITRQQNEQTRQTEIAKVSGMTVSETSVAYGTMPQATLTEQNGVKHLALQVERGPQGAPYTIKGNAYATLAALEADATAPAEGDQYNVGAAAPYNVYRWTGSTWEDQGELQGAQGPAGAAGADGADGADGAAGASAYEVAVAGGFVGTEAEWLASLVGPAGANGADGADGAAGAAGTDAIAGKDVVSLPTTGWSGTGPYTYQVSAADVTATNDVLATPAPTSHEHYCECGVYASAQGSGTLTFTAKKVPTTALSVNVLILS